MKRFEGVLLACDFDNTIAPTGEYISKGLPFLGVPEKNLEAIRFFIAEGGRFAVVTGRAYQSFIHLYPLIPANAPTALFNGAGLYDFERGEYLFRRMMPEDLHLHVSELLEAFPGLGFEAYSWDGETYAFRPNEYMRRHRDLTRTCWTAELPIGEITHPLAKMLFEDERELLLQVQSYLRSRPWYSGYETVFSGKHLLELTARDANKGTAVRLLAEHYGIGREHIYCAGDEENDLDMLEYAAEAFVPADCNPALRAHPFRVVGPSTEAGIADIIAVLGEKYR